MRALIFLSVFMAALFADSTAEDITDTFQIRNAKTGIPINLNRSSKNFNYQNWVLKDLGIDKKIKGTDPHADALPFGYVQFAVAADTKQCLSIAPSGFLALKDCEKDYQSGEFESVFQMIPTDTSAVQLRSLVLAKNECLGIFSNPNVDILDRVGLVDCVLDDIFSIEPARLFTLAPPLSAARVVR